MRSTIIAFIATALTLTTFPCSAQSQPVSLPQLASLPAPIQMHGTAAVGERLYVVGGNNATGWSDRVLSADIHKDASLGTWRTETPLPEPRGYISNSTVAAGNCIYVMAGSTGPADDSGEDKLEAKSDLVWTSVRADGSLAPWQRCTNKEKPRSCAAAAASNTMLFISGGKSGNNILDSVLGMELGPDGKPGEPHAIGKLPLPLWFHGMAVVDGRMYVWGGLDNLKADKVNARCFSCVVDAKGALGEWREEAPMPQPVYSAAFCGASGFLVSVSGRYVNSYPTNVIWYAQLDSGKVGPWQALNTDLTAHIYHSIGLDAARGFVFITGGKRTATPGVSGDEDIITSVQAFQLGAPKAKQLTGTNLLDALGMKKN